MTSPAERFYNSVRSVDSFTQARLIDLFAYFVQEELGQPSVSAWDVRAAFEACDLPVPGRISAHLSERSKGRSPSYIKLSDGYRLARQLKEELAALLGAEVHTVQIPAELRKLETQLPDGPRRKFITEALDCFGVDAHRATMIMMWLLTLDHLYEFILAKHLSAFNGVLASNTDRRIRITCVAARDDFAEIPEGKFIEFCRSAGIISKDARKILDDKLGTRNSAAHPSTIVFTRAKVVDFAEDLFNNVILKYPL